MTLPDSNTAALNAYERERPADEPEPFDPEPFDRDWYEAVAAYRAKGGPQAGVVMAERVKEEWEEEHGVPASR